MTTQKQERVALGPNEVLKLEGWIQQLESSCAGISISRAALVSWLISLHPEQLREVDRKQIKDRVFDDVKQVEWMLRELKFARARGESKSINDLLRKSKEKTQTNENLLEKGERND